MKRSCATESIHGGDDCKSSSSPSFVKTVFCETCRKDRCNGHISTDYTEFTDAFPPGELNQFTPTPRPEEPPLEEDLDDMDEDNDIGKDAGRRGNLVTHPEHQTDKVTHQPDPEMEIGNGNSASQSSVLSALTVVSLAMWVAHLFSR